MRPGFFKAVCLALACVGSSPVYAACTRPAISGEAQPLPPNGAFDQRLASRLILEEVNVQRCAQGLPRLEDDPGIVQVSTDHSAWMARAATMSHTSTEPGREDLRQRLDASRFPFRTGAENVAFTSLYAFGDDSFFVQGTCQFENAATGQVVPLHSYATLARELVTMWMNSPGHRKNILTSGIDHAGAGIALDRNADHCGNIYATHIFAGRR